MKLNELKKLVRELIREELNESPQIGYGIDWRQLAQISDLIGSQANSPNIKIDVDDDHVWLSGPVFGNYKDMWCVLFKKQDNKLHCCFACLIKQIPNIEEIITYQPKFSFKMTNFPEKVATKTYVHFMKTHRCNVVSDETRSDAGERIWKEMLETPELKNKMFVWDNKNKKRIDTINPNDIWGNEDKFKDILIVLQLI